MDSIPRSRRRERLIRPTFILASLSGCSGCISSLFSMEILGEILNKFNIVHAPFIIDQVSVPDCDVALIEGCILDENKEQVEYVKSIREHAKKVIALGTCAAFGGIASLSPGKQADPVERYIEIDGFIPGCPPPPALLNDSAVRLMEGKRIVLSDRNLCASCELRGENMHEFTRLIESITPPISTPVARPAACFLKEGILCMGPVTREGCETRCIRRNTPCEGCMGPPSQEYTSNVVNFFSMLPLSAELKKYKGMLFRFGRPHLIGGKQLK
jgi:F420-non-reducing hydrogenase small subunit